MNDSYQIKNIWDDLSKTLKIVNNELSSCPSHIMKVGLPNQSPLNSIIRPAMVILSSHLFKGPCKETQLLAAIFQLAYIANEYHCLVHDSSNAEQKDIASDSHFAVLIGDYLYSRSYSLLCEIGLNDFLIPLAKIVCEVNEGGILEKLNPDAEGQLLLQIVRMQTAELFAGACMMGSTLAKANNTQQQSLYELGKEIGMVYGLVEKNKIFESKLYLSRALASIKLLPVKEIRTIFEHMAYACFYQDPNIVKKVC